MGLVYGVGTVDLPTKENGETLREYRTWMNMLYRCYSGKVHTYEGCKVCEEWLVYFNFKRDIQLLKGFENKGWHLDKDLIF